MAEVSEEQLEDLDQIQLEVEILQKIKRAKDTGNVKERDNQIKNYEAITSPSDISKDVGAIQAGVVGLGSGLTRGFRGIRTLFNMATGDDEEVKELRDIQRQESESLRALRVRNPILLGLTEIGGEIASTLPLGLGIGGAALKGTGLAAAKFGASEGAKKLLPRVAGGFAGGASEGAIIGSLEDKTASTATLGGAIGATAEAVLPRIGKVLGKVFRRSIEPEELATLVSRPESGPIGPSPELAEALDSVGLNFGDITEAALKDIPASEQTATQAARAAVFEREGIKPAGRSRITQSHDDFAQALQLSRQSGSGAADEVREAFFKENDQLIQRFIDTADELGVPEKTGESIGRSFNNLKSNLSSAVVAAYKNLGEIAAETDPTLLTTVPLNTRNLVESVIDVQSFLPAAQADVLDSILAKFGIIGKAGERRGNKTSVDFDGDIITIRGDVTPLTIANTEAFRKTLNKFFNPADPTLAAASRQVIPKLDQLIDETLEGFSLVTKLPKKILESAKIARSLFRAKKVIFDQKDIVSRLTGTKPGTVTPLVEASKVFDTLKSQPLEQINKLLGVLRLDPKGDKAIANLQASTITNFLEGALSARGRKITDVEGEKAIIFSGNSLTKSIDNFGRGKLNSIFSNQPGIMQRLSRLEKIGQFRITPDSAVQKGSAPDLINFIIRHSKILRRLPFLGDAASAGAVAVGSRKNLKKFRNLAPDTELPPSEIAQSGVELDDFIDFNAPRLRAVLGFSSGVSSATSETEI